MGDRTRPPGVAEVRALPDAREFAERVAKSLSGPSIQDIVWPGLTDAVRLDQSIGRRIAESGVQVLGALIDPTCHPSRSDKQEEFLDSHNQSRYHEYLQRLAKTGQEAMVLGYRVQHGMHVKFAVKRREWELDHGLIVRGSDTAPLVLNQDQSVVQPRLYVVK